MPTPSLLHHLLLGLQLAPYSGDASPKCINHNRPQRRLVFCFLCSEERYSARVYPSYEYLCAGYAINSLLYVPTSTIASSTQRFSGGGFLVDVGVAFFRFRLCGQGTCDFTVCSSCTSVYMSFWMSIIRHLMTQLLYRNYVEQWLQSTSFALYEWLGFESTQ